MNVYECQDLNYSDFPNYITTKLGDIWLRMSHVYDHECHSCMTTHVLLGLRMCGRCFRICCSCQSQIVSRNSCYHRSLQMFRCPHGYSHERLISENQTSVTLVVLKRGFRDSQNLQGQTFFVHRRPCQKDKRIMWFVCLVIWCLSHTMCFVHDCNADVAIMSDEGF